MARPNNYNKFNALKNRLVIISSWISLTLIWMGFLGVHFEVGWRLKLPTMSKTH